VTAGLVIGLILIGSGGYVALNVGIPRSLPIFLAGLGLILALSAANRRHRHANADLRRSIDFATTALNASLLAGILLVCNVIAFRYGGPPLDLTRERANSLSSQTVNQLATLTRPVQFTLVFGQGPRALAQRERVAQLLELYRAVNPAMIKVESEVNPLRGEEPLKRAPDLAVLQGGGVLIEYGEGEQTQAVVVRNRDMFPPPPSSRPKRRDEQFATEFTGEDAITSALIRLREAKKAKVAFTTGHGEPSINDLNPRGDGLGIWKSRLTAAGCDVFEIDLIREEIADDLALLVVAGPKTSFKAEEAAKIKAFADRRGPLLLILGDPTASGLEGLLRGHHLEIGRGIATDLRLNLNGVPQVVFAVPGESDVHPIVHTSRSRRILIPEAAPIRIISRPDSQSPPPTPGLVATPILKTGNQSWAEVDGSASQPKFDRGADAPGPVVVGAAVAELKPPEGSTATQSDPKPRLVLFSSRAIAGNLVVGIENSNLDLVMNAASWLRDRPDAVGISPSTHVALQLTVDPALRARLVIVPTVTALIVIIGIGITVYLTRRE
jgi:hypothetical protein